MSNFPAVAYHEDGTHVIVHNAQEAKALGAGYTDKPNEKTIRALRKASGSSKTDQNPGVYTPTVMESY